MFLGDLILQMETILSSANPPEGLRDYALELSRNGLGREAIYALFREMFDKLEAQGRETDQGHFELILDSIIHFMSPDNPLYLDLPK